MLVSYEGKSMDVDDYALSVMNYNELRECSADEEMLRGKGTTKTTR